MTKSKCCDIIKTSILFLIFFRGSEPFLYFAAFAALEIPNATRKPNKKERELLGKEYGSSLKGG